MKVISTGGIGVLGRKAQAVDMGMNFLRAKQGHTRSILVILNGNKRMTVIKDRIQQLGLSESDCAPLKEQQLAEVLSAVKLTGSDRIGKATEIFSIAETPPEVVAARLNSLGVHEDTVWICWPGFREGFEIKWNLFVSRFDDLWYPSSDDVIVTAPTADWMLEISHEETIRFFRIGAHFRPGRPIP